MLACCSWRFAVLASCLTILSFRHAFLHVPRQCRLSFARQECRSFVKLRFSEEASCERRFVDSWFVIVELRLKPARSHEGCHAFAKVIMCAAFTHKMSDGIYEFLPSGIY